MMVVRLLLALLAAFYVWWGAWASIAPRHFFDTFPGFGRRWTAAYPPYNEHLVADLGATFLTLGFLLAVGAAVAERRIRRIVLGAVLLFNTLHLFFHATDHGTLSGSDLAASLATLAIGVLAPAALLLLDRRQDVRRQDSRRWDGRRPAETGSPARSPEERSP